MGPRGPLPKAQSERETFSREMCFPCKHVSSCGMCAERWCGRVTSGILMPVLMNTLARMMSRTVLKKRFSVRQGLDFEGMVQTARCVEVAEVTLRTAKATPLPPPPARLVPELSGNFSLTDSGDPTFLLIRPKQIAMHTTQTKSGGLMPNLHWCCVVYRVQGKDIAWRVATQRPLT